MKPGGKVTEIRDIVQKARSSLMLEDYNQGDNGLQADQNGLDNTTMSAGNYNH